ncbi:MAG: YceD family protein [Candidatus Limnocylindrus sp.]
MESDSAGSLPPLYPVDLSPLLAESAGGSFTVEPFTVEDRVDEELFRGLVQVRIDRTNRGVRIVGTVRGSQEGVCGRCLAPVASPLSAPIDEESVEVKHATEGALLIGKGNSVDIGRIAIEALDLIRRLVLLCVPPCPERCGLCGANHAATVCPERGLDPRFAGLAALLHPEGDEGAPIG